MYRLITMCAVSLLLLGCESAQQMADREAAEARELNWQRKYIQERAEPPLRTKRRINLRRTLFRGRKCTQRVPNTRLPCPERTANHAQTSIS